MSAEEALTARLADLESDSFQLKLRNYYLERRVSKAVSYTHLTLPTKA